ncbi:ABC transporter ATP-binding protein [Legionella jamestowniensis]|uniref:ABC transporter ATP-binding protein n=1 Tax=Legionella jamestowniensis TaxID=455 RepID=A0A0W0UK77_9GAMM|nr:ABC transporter ATP-binding protein [Legionella jamestowniensis]KTD08291.1 ABC transporter ATP-binding protein [Legionella jamestowniensis]OCH97183.1 multidrug ABC transporter ATP-binding protein [Legionella jamestowniensis]SFL49340.1 ABC-2 type transport system ATP-binding protein [Legionella jamestowniensis DSM 19215]
MNQAVIDVQDLRKSFNNRVAVNGINLCVKKGDVFGFLGPNGSGKTTTIRMLCGLLTPDAGHGTCLGYNILTESEKIKQHVGYMTQRFSFYFDLSVEENLSFIARVYKLDNRKERVEKALEDLGLVDRRRQLTGALSGGWKQRMALAASLLHEPQLLLLDEPTAGVDPIARREFWDHIHALSEQGITTLVSTHYMDEAERCTCLAYLAYGDLLVTGTVKDVIEKTGLYTWEVVGEVTTFLLQKTKILEGVTQAALFGNKIHICGFEPEKIESELNRLAKEYPIHWKSIESTLEDAFISLVKKTHGAMD